MCVINGLTEDCGAETGNVFNISKHRWAHWRSPHISIDSYNDAYVPYDVNMWWSARWSFTHNCCVGCILLYDCKSFQVLLSLATGKVSHVVYPLYTIFTLLNTHIHSVGTPAHLCRYPINQSWCRSTMHMLMQTQTKSYS